MDERTDERTVGQEVLEQAESRDCEYGPEIVQLDLFTSPAPTYFSVRAFCALCGIDACSVCWVCVGCDWRASAKSG